MFFIVIQLGTQDILKGRVRFSPFRPFEYVVPRSTRFTVVVPGNGHKAAACRDFPRPAPHSGGSGKEAERENFLLLSPRWEWAIPEAIQSSCLITSSNLQFQLQTSPRACLHHSAEGAPLVGEATHEGGRLWGPRQETRGAGSFQRLSS